MSSLLHNVYYIVHHPCDILKSRLSQVKILFTLVYCSSIGSVYLKIESVHGRTATRCKFLKTDSIRRQESLTRKAI